MKSKYASGWASVRKLVFVLCGLWAVQGARIEAQQAQDFASAEAYAQAIHEEALLCTGLETVFEEIETANYIGARASIKNLEHSFPIVERRIERMPPSYRGDGELWQAADRLVAYSHALTKELKELVSRAEASGLSDAMRATLTSRRQEWARLLDAYKEARARFLRTHGDEGPAEADAEKQASALTEEVLEYNEFLNELRRKPKAWLSDVVKGFEKRIVSIPGTVGVNEVSLLYWSGSNLRKLERWEGIPHQELVKPAAIEYMRFLRYEFFPWLHDIYEEESEIFGDRAATDRFWREVHSKWKEFAQRHNDLAARFIEAQKAFLSANASSR